MLKIILIVVAGLLIAFVVYVALRPADFRIERSATISVPAAVVFARVNDLHAWQEFSPWAKLDPNAKITFAGPPAGNGAAFTWVGNSDIGEGTMTITESKPAELVRFRLDFLKPMASTSTAEFAFKESTGGTTVTWSMFGKNNFVARTICLFINMDKMIGGQFEEGLAKLKELSEAAAKK